MKLPKSKTVIFSFILSAMAFSANAQRVDLQALKDFDASTVRDVHEVCQHVSITPQQQVDLAKKFQKENEQFVEMVRNDEGYLELRNARKLNKMHDRAIAQVLDGEQLAQYYRGVYSDQAQTEGHAVANRLQAMYHLTDQNTKFIRNALFKLALESKVLRKTMAEQPAKAEKMIKKLCADLLDDIEQRGGIRVDPDAMTVEYTREFNPNTLRRE